MILLDLFVSQNKITEEESKEIESKIEESDGSLFVDDFLLQKGILSSEITQVRSVLYGLPVYQGEVKKDVNLSKFISTQQSKQMLALPLEQKDDVLYVGVVDPDYKNVLESLQFLLGGENKIYKVYLVPYESFKNFFGEKMRSLEEGGSLVDSVKKEDAEGISYVKSAGNESVSPNDKSDSSESLLDISNIDAVLDSELAKLSVPEIISMILRYAIDHNASDIHIEHVGDSVRARVRVDGSLDTVTSLPIKIHAMLVARIKILCSMKLDEKRKPQDGRFSTRLQDHSVDYRVSTFPGYYGEKVVIRILDSYHGVRSLDTLGFTKRQMEEVRKALAAPYGIILISGPTGSGKTTTLYSMLNEIDREHRNVVSLEDPIEYNVPSMNQSQVFPEIGYTFASGLRSILRQDPDVIMVGEIRDAETAQLAIQAALTGHLVFSTIHTNTAVGVLTRLLDMGIEPYLIAPTLNLAIGQRLVRKIADGCAKPLQMDPGMQAMITEQFADLPDEFKKDLPLVNPFNEPVPSAEFKTGMKGRVPVFEVLTISEGIEDAVLSKKSEDEIWDIARKQGITSMKEDAMIKSMEGIVPFAEIAEL